MKRQVASKESRRAQKAGKLLVRYTVREVVALGEDI